MSLDENVIIKNFECSILNSRKINVKANLEVDCKVHSNENVEIINRIENIENIQTLNTQIDINSLIGQGMAKTSAKDTITVEATDELAEIMKMKMKIINKEARISYNKVLVKADADAQIMYLTEDNRISTINTRLPIMGFIDIPNISDDNVCDVKCKLKNLIVKPNNIESHSIYVEAEIELVCFVYETRPINIIEDLYSTSSNLTVDKKEIRTMVGKSNKKDVYNMKEQIEIPEMGANKLYDVDVNPMITDIKTQNGRAIIEGEANLEFMYESNSGMGKNNMSLPFSLEMASGSIEELSTVELEIEIVRENFTIVSDGNVELDIGLEFNLNISKQKEIRIIEEVTVEEMKDDNIYSMVIYFVKPGDTLWKIAKKFRSTVSDIKRVNDTEDENKIYPGQQLYIPKYVRREVAV